MQCPSCRFENMPGLDSCGRCGTSLSVSTATLDVNPPRASRTMKGMRQGRVRFPRMMAMAAFVSLALAVLIYVPTGQLLMGIAAPIEYTANSPPFQLFDVVLVNHWAYALTSPRRGDVVLFSPRNNTRGAAGQFGNRRYEFEENQLIDRLVGLPGDRVVWDGGRLSLNGEAMEWK